MAEFSQNRSKRRDGEVLGGAVDFLLANARLVLGVGGAAVLGIATLAVKRGLQAGAADPVRLLVPLALEPGLWSLVAGLDTVAQDPRCWAVRRTQLEFRPRGSSPWDRFLVGGYLSSRVLLELLRKALTASVNWPAIGSLLGCLIRPRVASDELLLEVQHECLELTVAVLLTVAGAQDGDLLLAWPLEGLAGNLWLQDWYPAEAARLRALDEQDAGTRRRLLLLLCTVCRGHPALWRLGRDRLAQVVLHLGEQEADWAEEALGEHFLQALELLLGSVERASLPSHFNRGVNLLDGLREEEIDDLGFALYRGLQAPEGLL
ncbi:MIEF2 [Cervus elaphus hippelaphus]|uniref:MIEF2 n=1 Tax=Cervus elaphus hippelaphus TaxID=46360 RepID=A0A212D6V0_CEREH|nr:MIEF2 [Cervus elaphus hippelaphus]